MSCFKFIVIFVLLLGSIYATKNSLSRQRIFSEFKDIVDQRLTLDIPFNTSSEEVSMEIKSFS